MNAAPDDMDFPDDLDALSQVCPACGAHAEYPDCAACGHDFSAVADPASAISYARGYGKFDATPRLMTAANFGSFRDVVLADRCIGKGQGWIMAPTAVAPGDSLHRASFPKSIGKPHRCGACVQPRGWMGFDIDGGLTPESFAALVIALQPLSAFTHTTASHTPTAPRCRIIVELDALADRAEMIRASAALRARLDAAMVGEGHPAPLWDAGCDRPEQMLYLPLVDSETFTMDGEPACLAELLAESAPEAVQATPAQADPQAAQGNAALVQAVLCGDTLHDASRDLLFRLIDDGTTQSKAVEIVRGLMLAMPDRGDPGRWQQRYADLPRMAGDAAAKLKPTPPSGWRVDRVCDLLAQPAPAQWLVRDHLERDSSCMLFGAPGSGKSFVAVDLACAVATGASWHGHKTTAGPVVYLAGEGHRGLRKRFLAWSIEHEAIPETLHLSSAAIDLSGNIDSVVEAVAASAAEPALVVVDTLHRHLPTGANENSGEDMGPFVAAADKLRESLGCAVVLVHHVGHAAGNRARGWSGIGGAMDWIYGVARGDGGPVIVTCTKSKDFEPPAHAQFKLHKVDLPWLDDDGEPESSAVLRVTNATEAGMGANQLLAMTSLRKLAGGREIITTAEWRADSGINRRRWKETQQALVDRGLILLEGDLVRPAEAPPECPSGVPP